MSTKPVSLLDYHNRASIGFRLRQRRIQPLLNMIDAVHKERGGVDIIDMGGNEYYWQVCPPGFLESRNVSILCVNPFRPQKDHGCFRFTLDDACALTHIGDGQFDIAHSNSVVEHVGDWKRMKAFASETRRVAKRYFVQTPNYWFPIEPHCVKPGFQWLPMPLQAWLVMHYKLGNFKRAATYDAAIATIDGTRLLNRKMMLSLFPDAEIHTERFCGLPKSLIAIR